MEWVFFFITFVQIFNNMIMKRKKILYVLLGLLLTTVTYSQTQTTLPNEVKFAENKAKGEAFLLKNGTKEEVASLPSGLQFQIIRNGTGGRPKLTDKVKVDYVGTLIDGTKFDSSIDRGEPAVFPVNAVIPGWVEALQLMPVGSKWILYIPQQLAYGGQQVATIPPYSTLIFEVELISIEK
jgi:FKBP-type peptidyl-prolyl cis-trans isomerase FklB